jgi:hypothetical protein
MWITRGGWMKAHLIAMAVAPALMAGSSAAFSANVIDDFVATAITGKSQHDARPSHVAVAPSGYIAYADSDAALPAPSCYWARKPLYDIDGSVIGWRGRPVAVCPEPRVSADLSSGR